MIVGKNKATARPRKTLIYADVWYEKTDESEFVIDGLPIINNKLIVNSQGDVTHLVEDDGTSTRILVTRHFRKNLCILMLTRPDTFFVDRNGYLNGFWEFRNQTTHNGVSHEPRLDPINFEMTANFQPYREHTSKWFCDTYGLRERIDQGGGPLSFLMGGNPVHTTTKSQTWSLSNEEDARKLWAHLFTEE